MSTITITNDKKEKHQSWVATCNKFHVHDMGDFDVSFTGCGATKEEAVKNLVKSIKTVDLPFILVEIDAHK